MKNKGLFIIIFVSSFIWGQEEVDIGYFYKSVIKYPVITLDPTYNTAYYMDVYNPNIFIDYNIMDININGSTFAPLGSYTISPLYLRFMLDTLSSTAFEHNKGDYGYYENIVFINNKHKNNLSSFLIMQGKKYDGLQSINSNSDILQNYFFNVTKDYLESDNQKLYGSISNSFMYHKENSIIPTNDLNFYNRYSDSYLHGVSVEANYLNFLKVNLSSSFQLTRGNHYLSLDLDEYTHWMNSNINFNLNKNISIFSLYESKNSSYQLDSLYNEASLNKIFLTAQFRRANTNLDLTLTSHYNAFDRQNLAFNFSFMYNPISNLFLSLNKITNSFMVSSNYIDSSIYIRDIYSLKMDYKNKFISFTLEPFQLVDYFSLTTINGLHTVFSFKNNYIISDLNAGLYLSENNYIPMNLYSNYSILLAPKINNKRYRPFIGVNGIFLNLNESSYIDLVSIGEDLFPFMITGPNFNSEPWDLKSVNLFSFQLGFILNQFKVSYHWTNPINEDILFSFSNSYQSIAPFSKLQVTWQFLD